MARQKNQSYKKTQSYKEIQADWRWIRSMDPKAAAEALQWMNEHPNERKELERILYYSEADFKKKFSSEELESAEKKAPISYNPEAFLPEEVRNAIYDDMRWFNRAKYMPENSEESPDMYLPKNIAEGLHELTELQREVLFRTVVNRESTESVARDKNCSSRNIRDIRTRALDYLRKRAMGDKRGDMPTTALFVIIVILAAAYFLLRPVFEIPPEVLPWYTYVLIPVFFAVAFIVYRKAQIRKTTEAVRQWWRHLNGSAEN